jgi:hypothetical protein
MPDEPKKPGHGCLFWGAIVGAVLLAVVIIAAVFGAYYARGLFNRFTSTQPAKLPHVELPRPDMARLQSRVDSFRDAVQAGLATPSLELSATELNALIANDADLLPLRDRIYVTINGNQLAARFSIAASELGFKDIKALAGRYINGAGNFSIAIDGGKLRITAESISAGGKPLPETIARQIRARNLADDLNRDRRVAAAISQLQAIEVRDGNLIIVPK